MNQALAGVCFIGAAIVYIMLAVRSKKHPKKALTGSLQMMKSGKKKNPDEKDDADI